MIASDLFFFGSGHGGTAALQSIQRRFGSIEIFSESDETLNVARPSDKIIANIEEVRAEKGVMAGFQGILSEQFLNRHKVLNVHYSLLPRYRGLHAVVWAILNLERKIGLTVHEANVRMDDGPIVYQHGVEYEGQTSWQLMELFDEHIRQGLGSVVEKWISGAMSAVPQDPSRATWVPRRNLEDCLVDYTWPVCRLRALFKALVRPYPLPTIIVRGRRYEIADARLMDAEYFCGVGRVVNIDGHCGWIKCADCLLVVSRLIDDRGIVLLGSQVLRLGMRLGS